MLSRMLNFWYVALPIASWATPLYLFAPEGRMVGASGRSRSRLIIGHQSTPFWRREKLYIQIFGASDYSWSGHDVSALRLSGGGPCHDESKSKADFYQLKVTHLLI
jgi:hypothetical protein